MYRLVETIKIINGVPQNISFHDKRMSGTLYDLFGIRNTDLLEDILDIPDNALTGIWKCRVEYERSIIKTEFLPYLTRNIKSLRIIHDDLIEYKYKFTDRANISRLFEMREGCDDILIIRSGLVTDTSYSNVIFKTHHGRWVTPSSYLLPGTMRASLLNSGRIVEEEIKYNDIGNYFAVKLINAMLGIEDTEEIPVTRIFG